MMWLVVPTGELDDSIDDLELRGQTEGHSPAAGSESAMSHELDTLRQASQRLTNQRLGNCNMFELLDAQQHLGTLLGNITAALKEKCTGTQQTGPPKH